MEGTGKTLSIGEIVEMNRQMLEVFGGLSFVEPNNFANEGSLHWVLDAIIGSIFGVEMYPTVPKKAAALGWNIMAKHIFNDANKRTGVIACETFLAINGYNLLIYQDESRNEVIELAIGAASKPSAKNYVDLQGFTEWVEKNSIPYDYSC